MVKGVMRNIYTYNDSQYIHRYIPTSILIIDIHG